MTEMLGFAMCNIFGHEETETTVRFDIPYTPIFVDDECMRDGFVCVEREVCTRCDEVLDSEFVPVTEERVEAYHDWFESQWGIRP